jgi:hypothetical protein
MSADALVCSVPQSGHSYSSVDNVCPSLCLLDKVVRQLSQIGYSVCRVVCCGWFASRLVFPEYAACVMLHDRPRQLGVRGIVGRFLRRLRSCGHHQSE